MQQLANLDFINLARILNLPPATTTGQPVTFEQLQAAIEQLSWKDNVVCAAQVNINVAAPGATIDGQTLVAGDPVAGRFLLRSQTTASENGIYIWNGAATPATRAPDMNLSSEFNSAIVGVDAGTDAGVTFRQTVPNPVVGTTGIVFTAFGVGAPSASTVTAGIARLATQAEVDAGVLTNVIVSPATLAASALSAKRFAASFGDGVATSFVVTHNFANSDLVAQVRRVSDNTIVYMDQANTTTNSITLSTAAGIVPTANQYRVSIVR
jgi:hypothetical protein